MNWTPGGLTETNSLNNGVQYIFKFENGYGASVIKSEMYYGGDQGLWELAVLSESGAIDYSTPITDDVLGLLEQNGVERILNQIKELTK